MVQRSQARAKIFKSERVGQVSPRAQVFGESRKLTLKCPGTDTAESAEKRFPLLNLLVCVSLVPRVRKGASRAL
jgi:hypothetical protein